MLSILPGYSLAQGNKPEEKNFLAVTAKSSFYRKGQKLVIYFWKAKEQLSLEGIINKGCRFRFSLQWYFLISALKVSACTPGCQITPFLVGCWVKCLKQHKPKQSNCKWVRSTGKLCIHAETLAGISDNLIAVSLCCGHTKHKPSKGSS